MPLRRDIIDRNEILISRNVKSFHAAVKPNLIKNKDNFLINIKLHFPTLPIKDIKKIKKDRYFLSQKRIRSK